MNTPNRFRWDLHPVLLLTFVALLGGVAVITPPPTTARLSQSGTIVAEARASAIGAFTDLQGTEVSGTGDPVPMDETTLRQYAEESLPHSLWRFYDDGTFNITYSPTRYVGQYGREALTLTGRWLTRDAGGIDVEATFTRTYTDTQNVVMGSTSTDRTEAITLGATLEPSADGVFAAMTSLVTEASRESFDAPASDGWLSFSVLGFLYLEPVQANLPAVPASSVAAASPAPSGGIIGPTPTPSSGQIGPTPTPGSADATGVIGTTYTDPTYGYRLSWSPEWQVVADSEATDYGLVLTNGISDVYLIATEDYGGAPGPCLADLVTIWFADATFSGATLATDGSGQPLRGGDASHAFEVYTYTYTPPGAASVPYATYLECRTLVPGGAVLGILHDTPLDAYNSQVPLRDALLATLTISPA